MEQSIPAELLTVSEAAQKVGVSRDVVRAWIVTGRLVAVRIDGRRYVHPEELASAQAVAHAGVVVPAWRRDRKRAGRRLRALREANGLSQIQLAAASGLTHEAISRLERGLRTPRGETARTLAHVLQVEPERFVGHDAVGLGTLNVGDAASWLGVPKGRLRTWLRIGVLPGTKVSGQWRILEVVVAELGRSGRLRGRSGRLDPRYRG